MQKKHLHYETVNMFLHFSTWIPAVDWATVCGMFEENKWKQNKTSWNLSNW